MDPRCPLSVPAGLPVHLSDRSLVTGWHVTAPAGKVEGHVLRCEESVCL